MIWLTWINKEYLSELQLIDEWYFDATLSAFRNYCLEFSGALFYEDDAVYFAEVLEGKGDSIFCISTFA